MTIRALAIYEDGALRLAAPLPLEERQRVHVMIETVEDAALPSLDEPSDDDRSDASTA